MKISSLIKGEKVELEHVNCPLVIGKNVKIGKGCKIDLVQYSDMLEISQGLKGPKSFKIGYNNVQETIGNGKNMSYKHL